MKKKDQELKNHLFHDELVKLRSGNHGGLKFEVFDETGAKLFSCYRVLLSGGLDYCNNQCDKLERAYFKVVISKRWGLARGQWSPVGYLERTSETQFNH